MIFDKEATATLAQPPVQCDKRLEGQNADLASQTSVTVSHKYMGTQADQYDMSVLGKSQVLRRNFKFFTMIGFGSTVICSWEVLFPVLPFVLINGGTAGLFWGFIGVAPGMVLVYISLAEMSSMCPTAGGQYHWVSEFAPPRYQKFLSYLTGWLCAMGWQVFLASVAFMIGGIIQGLIAFNNPDYGFEAWHATLLTIAVMAFAIVFNTVLAGRLPIVQGFALVVHLAGFFAVFVTMWTMARKAPAREVLLTFTNRGGWSNTGVSAMIGLTTPISQLIGYDCSVHMSEELLDASLTMPKSIMWAVGPNCLLAFLMAVTVVFTAGDIDDALGTSTRQPFIQIFYNGTQSYTATNAMVAVLVVCLSFCCISEVATASRQFWSFARDNGLPASKWISHVTPRLNIPLRAVCISFLITSLLACINLGSTTALNAINALGAVSVLSSYLITIACMIWRRLRGAPLPPRRWSLGRYGLWINVAAVLWLTPMWFFEFWPLAVPVTAQSMNWACVMFFGVLILSLIYYLLHGRNVYTGPVMQVKRDM